MKLWAILPELVLAGCCLGLVPVAGLARRRSLPIAASAAGLAACILLTVRMLSWEPVATFEGTYAVDGLANVFKLVILTGALLALPALWSYFAGKEQLKHAPIAVLFTTLGAVGLVSSRDLGLLILFLQMLSMGIYVLAALVRNDFRGLEAGIKYFIYGALALAVMAYGLTFLYGMTGSLDLQVIGERLGSADRLWIGLALSLILVGFGFEVTMVPFHPWAPDVLDGATGPVSGFVSVVPKVAAFGALMRFLLEVLPGELARWPLIIALLAIVTMTVGNLAALRQVRLKRLLAYSTIAQSGYVLMAVAVAGRTAAALPAAVFYLGAYTLMNLAAFAVAAHLERSCGSDAFEVLRGLGRTAPLPSITLTLALLSLAGIPPLAGFAGKVLLLSAAIDGGMTWLAVAGAANMVVALYYYVRVIAELYMKKAEYDVRLPDRAGFTLAYAAMTLGTLTLGIFPGPFLDLVDTVTKLLGS